MGVSLFFRTMTILTLAGAAGCTTSRQSAVGFRLPENGNIDRGNAAFAALNCHACHTVKGVELPAVESAITTKVPLGGDVYEVRTDGYLVTSIIHPSHKLASQPKERISVEGESKMPDYTHRMSVRQLIDLVAFLQSTYRVLPPPVVH
ncbi:MAG: cytochrome c [Acidobacteriia bacterium]|nr:cytochrome c [Terriglobia bacterium]